MRVTEKMISENYLYNYDKIIARKTKLQTQIANNSKIETLSDDLAGSLESIKVESQRKKTETYLKNVENAKDFMSRSLQSLENMTGEIQKIISAAVSAGDALNAQNYGTIAQTIKNSLNAIVQNVNTQQNDMYLFGGTNFQNPPVTLDINGKAVLSTDDLSGEIITQVSQNVKEAINIPGSKVLGTGLFQSINSIIDSLAAGNEPSQTERTNLENAYKEILNLQSIGGTTINRIDDRNEVLKNQLTNLQELLVREQGVDVPALIVDLQNQDYLLQVSYKLLATAYPKSLFDFL
ncbi:MAG: flagellin [Bacteroidota bacterium]